MRNRGVDLKGIRTIFKTAIRDNVALAEAPSIGQSIFDYRSQSYGAQDYAALAREFMLRVKKL